MKSFMAEVQTGTDPKWYTNALRFKTEQEAQAYAVDLAWRWTLVVDYRVSESDDEPNR